MVSWSPRSPSLNRRSNAWRRRAEEPGDLLYVAIGDSAAQGIGSRSLETSYVGLLARRIRLHSGRSVSVANLSRYGVRLDDAVRRQLPEMRDLGMQPDVVTVAIGANDMRTFDFERFSERLEALIAGLPRHAIVADIPCFHTGPREVDAVAASCEIADRVHMAGLAFAPLHRVTERRRGWGSFREFSWDQFHPSALGYRVWESAFAGAVTRRAKELRADERAQ